MLLLSVVKPPIGGFTTGVRKTAKKPKLSSEARIAWQPYKAMILGQSGEGHWDGLRGIPKFLTERSTLTPNLPLIFIRMVGSQVYCPYDFIYLFNHSLLKFLITD